MTDEAIQPVLTEQDPLIQRRYGSRSKNFYQIFLRWLAREDMLDKLSMMLLSESFEYSQTPNPLQKLKDYLYYFFRGSSYPRLNRRAVTDSPTQRYAVINDFLTGVGVVTEKLWPLVLFILQVHDFSVYHAEPENRFGNTPGKILAGTSETESSYSSHLGSDLPGTTSNYLPLILILSTAVMGGIIQRAINWKQDKITKPLSNLYWTEAQEDYTRNNDVDGLITITQEGAIVQKIAALRQLAIIADNFEPRSLKLAGIKNMDVEDERQRALTALKQSKHIYANYLVWSLGESKNIISHLVYLPIALYIIYAKARLCQIIIEKIMGLASYNLSKKKCESEQKQWTYLPNFGDYVCAVCPDWAFVYYENIFTDQDCLDGLMSVTQPSAKILKYIDAILVRANISKVDLSKQHPETWAEKDWAGFLSKISSKITALKIFNLSLPTGHLITPKQSYIESLRKFLDSVKINALDLSNLGLGDDYFSSMIPEIFNASVEALNLSGNFLTDYSIIYLSESAGLNNSFVELDVSNNQISDEGLLALAENFNASSLTVFKANANYFGAKGVTALSKYLPQSQIVKCDLAENDLSQADMEQFGNAVANTRSLEVIDLSETNLDDISVSQLSRYFNQSALTTVILSGNPFSDEGFLTVIKNSQNSTVSVLAVNRVSMTDTGLTLAAKILLTTNIHELKLSGCQSFGFNGLSSLFEAISNDNSKKNKNWSIDISDNNLGDSLGDIFFQKLNKTTKIQKINLSKNNLTDKAGIKIISVLNNTNIAVIDLSANQLSDVVFIEFAKYLDQLVVRAVNWNNNKILGNSSMTEFFKNLPFSKLKELFLANNQLSSEFAMMLAQKLIKPQPPLKNLGKTLSRDEARALRKSKPNTELSVVDLSNNQITTTAAKSLCQVLGATKIKINDLDLENNPIDSSQLDIISCRQVLASSEIFFPENSTLANNNFSVRPVEYLQNRVSPVQQNNQSNASSYLGAVLMPGVTGVILGCIALYLLYIAIRPVVSRGWNSSSNFFKNNINTRENNTENTDCVVVENSEPRPLELAPNQVRDKL